MTTKIPDGMKALNITVLVPDDYELDTEDREWIEYILKRTADRGSSLEDTEVCLEHQYGHKKAIEGARRAQRFVLARAGDAFIAKKDDEANRLRGLATAMEDLLKELEKERAEHERLFFTSYQEEVSKRRAENKKVA